MKNLKIIFISILIILFASGCGTGGGASSSNDSNTTASSDTNTTSSVVSVLYLNKSEITATSNNEAIEFKVRALDVNNQIIENGNINIIYPSPMPSGGVGTFSSHVVAVSNGEATFTYIAPSDITDKNSTTFTFYHEDTPSLTTQLLVKFDTIPVAAVLPEVVLINNSQTIDTNEQQFTITIDVYENANNTPYTDGNVSIEYPDAIKTHDLGIFSNHKVAVVNGEAQFIYTAPKNITDEANNSYIFNFYHDENPTQKVPLTITFSPLPNQIIDTTYVLNFKNSSNDAKLPIESDDVFTMALTDENGNLVADDKIIDLNITTLNSNIASFIKPSDGSTVSIINDNNNSVGVKLETNTLSGLAPIEISISFIDENGNPQSIIQVFNVIVMSGPPTAISLSYASSSNDNANAKMIEKWVVTVSDKYFNKVNTNPTISMGAIVGFADNGKGTNTTADYLYYTTSDGNGTINSNDSFSSSLNIFNNVDNDNDILLTFGNGYTYNASGKWDISSHTVDTIYLDDNYSGNTISNLGFAVGHNNRQDQCVDATEWVGNVSSSDGNYTVGDNGSALIDINYDYYLTGKDIVLYVNLLGENKATNEIVRIGESRKLTLRAMGTAENTRNYGCGYVGTDRFYLTINDTEEPYKNSNFIPNINSSGDVIATVNSTSMANGIDSCTIQNGRAYIDVDINASVGNCEGGSVTINGTVSNEF